MKIVASDGATLYAQGARDRQDVWEARTRGIRWHHGAGMLTQRGAGDAILTIVA